MQGVLRKVLEKIAPPAAEREEVERHIKSVLGKLKVKDAEAILGGSGAKDTWLKGDYDVDIYLMFDYGKYKAKSGSISGILHKALKKSFGKVDVLHGSRDYFQIKSGRFTFEIVPILKIAKAEDAMNITDVSPLHSKWVKRFGLGNEIRLAKAFCKAQGCYGAESYVQGFSGYVLEILVIYYGSFEKLIRAAAEWGERESIDIEKHGTDINSAKKVSPLIVIDPVQPGRNAAAALGRENYTKFKEAARRFIEAPSEKFFEPKRLCTANIRAKAGKGRFAAIVEAEPLPGKEDIIGSKLLKAFSHIRLSLASEGFRLIESGWQWEGKGPAMFWFILPKKQLPELKEHEGPMVMQEKHVKSFMEKNRKYKIVRKKGRLYALIPRKHRSADKLVSALIAEDDRLKKQLKKAMLIA